MPECSRPKILFLVSLLFVALLNPKFNPYLLFKFLIFYHSSIYIYIYIYMKLCLIKVAKSDACIRLLFANPVTYVEHDLPHAYSI